MQKKPLPFEENRRPAGRARRRFASLAAATVLFRDAFPAGGGRY
jgi:hypothetical protein